MSAQKIVLTKTRLSGNVMIRADRKELDEQLGAGTWVNLTLRGLPNSAAYAREKAEQYAAIADELDSLVASEQEADW
ncbi:hypothetical protein CH249_02005 [Rhodococcus sp. 05-2255-3B1]|uniref:hypothetical protein n=1 Tax=unclassified Rhodococcus (in: high G+C Gram-positive bacteria) TaxID=192944 RepID=UPI000B9C10F3|nr:MULTISPECIES: hypothetical protein [unclassified Rhodococcus (in: high G+C Gram-positive bacteria)]OZE13343.1 hypothetical protein CH250_05360 [Rhodococcus sp. 05-2255-3C]OZE16045.1 hypothetical protein CH249_02005 [Rhodococcus sp. 05-2255-3B1]OZE19085.1 hypothetical protein CH255_14030 [Rhodococcus sp. 05-2255-2A2]